MNRPVAMIMAGGTGGHIMPGLAVARELRSLGWDVVWLGNPARLEGQLVPKHGIMILPLQFSGLRGKGVVALLRLPFALIRSCWQAYRALRQSRPTVVVGMGGYVAFPGGLMAVLYRTPLIIHEQNAVAGTANRWLARLAGTVLAGFPGALKGAQVVGNPVRPELTALTPVAERYEQRQGRIRLLVVGGSLGALPINQVLPAAMARLAHDDRPEIRHQSGEQHLQSLLASYEAHGVTARCEAFIEDMPAALAWADVMICRAGAMTVAEVAAAGMAALFIPLPHAIDDHQSVNARFLTDQGAAWCQTQNEFTPEWLAKWLLGKTRSVYAQMAARAHSLAQPLAAQRIAKACVQAAEAGR